MLGLYYMGNPSLFTQLEIESTTNLFAKPNEQKDACIKSAMARMPKASRTEAALSPKGRGADSGGESEAAKGGCEETNFIQSLINPKGDQGDDAE